MQTDASVNLSSQISLAGATYGDFGVYDNSLVISAESNNWDFVMRLTYGSSGGVATVLVASPASDGLSASPEGVAVDSTGDGPHHVALRTRRFRHGDPRACRIQPLLRHGKQPRAVCPDARSDERPRHRQRRDHG